MAIPSLEDFNQLITKTNSFNAFELYEEASLVERDFDELKSFLIKVSSLYEEKFTEIRSLKAYKWLSNDANYINAVEREFGCIINFSWGEEWASSLAVWLLSEPLELTPSENAHVNLDNEFSRNLRLLCGTQATVWLCEFARMLADYFYVNLATFNKKAIKKGIPKLKNTIALAMKLDKDLSKYSYEIKQDNSGDEIHNARTSISKLIEHLQSRLEDIDAYSGAIGNEGDTLEVRYLISGIWQWFAMQGMGSKSTSIIDLLNIEGIKPVSQRSVEMRVRELKDTIGDRFINYPAFNSNQLSIGSITHSKLQLMLMGVDSEGKINKIKI